MAIQGQIDANDSQKVMGPKMAILGDGWGERDLRRQGAAENDGSWIFGELPAVSRIANDDY